MGGTAESSQLCPKSSKELGIRRAEARAQALKPWTRQRRFLSQMRGSYAKPVNGSRPGEREDQDSRDSVQWRLGSCLAPGDVIFPNGL